MQSLITISLVNVLVITLAVLAHHESLILLSQMMGKRQEKARPIVIDILIPCER